MDADALAWALAQPAGDRWRRLADAYTSGTREVTFADGRKVAYRTMDEIATAISAGYRVSLSTTSRRPNMTIARVGDGYL